ncbi:hypothetical protein TDSAC_1179 [Thermodesulfobium acidiphilum]|uniref:Uncharacterized protein n=1 Tax=Thermodesulfobium acidiphilum TaxID=1794699 RepID=A0A2R4W1B8_THEAF|nr:hypothetical protein [Thermodesulfobium acidiphilum]AWB10524.1 hypothetical protein TDSAC_1179 [Thermodesulfobium acidiphilum]
MYTAVGLANKLREIYPNLGENKLNFSVVFEKDKDAWLITFFKGNLKRYAYLDKRDADLCMEGQKCIYLEFIIDQYLRIFEEEEKK